MVAARHHLRCLLQPWPAGRGSGGLGPGHDFPPAPSCPARPRPDGLPHAHGCRPTFSDTSSVSTRGGVFAAGASSCCQVPGGRPGPFLVSRLLLRRSRVRVSPRSVSERGQRPRPRSTPVSRAPERQGGLRPGPSWTRGEFLVMHSQVLEGTTDAFAPGRAARCLGPGHRSALAATGEAAPAGGRRARACSCSLRVPVPGARSGGVPASAGVVGLADSGITLAAQEVAGRWAGETGSPACSEGTAGPSALTA